jgi:hypothetical protein
VKADHHLPLGLVLPEIPEEISLLWVVLSYLLRLTTIWWVW